MSENKVIDNKNIDNKNADNGVGENNEEKNSRKQNMDKNSKNNQKDNKQKKNKVMFAHKGMHYQSKEDGLIHDWNCPVLKNVNLQDFDEVKEIPTMTGCICSKCGRGLLLKKYTDDKEEGRALSRFLGDNGISTEFLCELYEVYHIYPYVYNAALKLNYKDKDWKIIKGENKLIIYHNEFGENMPGWFNDYWKVNQELENATVEDAIKVILAKD